MARVRGSGPKIRLKRPMGVSRVKSVSRASAPSRKVAPAGLRGVAGAAYFKGSRPGSKSIVPKINIRVPDIHVPNVAKGIGDAFSHFAPQDVLFRQIGERIQNPTRKR